MFCNPSNFANNLFSNSSDFTKDEKVDFSPEVFA